MVAPLKKITFFCGFRNKEEGSILNLKSLRCRVFALNTALDVESPAFAKLLSVFKIECLRLFFRFCYSEESIWPEIMEKAVR